MTKNNLSKCLAWLLQHNEPPAVLDHIKSYSNNVALDQVAPLLEDEEISQDSDMARLQLAPQSHVKPRLLTHKSPHGLPTPVPSRSPHVASSADVSPTVETVPQTPKLSTLLPKTPATIYDDSVFDIDDLDDLLNEPQPIPSRFQSSTPTRPKRGETFSDEEDILASKAKKRKSDEFCSDYTSPYPAAKRQACPNSSSKRRPELHSGSVLHTVDKHDSLGTNDNRHVRRHLPGPADEDRIDTHAEPLSRRAESGHSNFVSESPYQSDDNTDLKHGLLKPTHTNMMSISARQPTSKIIPDFLAEATAVELIKPFSSQSFGVADEPSIMAHKSTGLELTETKDAPVAASCEQIRTSSAPNPKHVHKSLSSSSPMSSGAMLAARSKLSEDDRRVLSMYMDLPVAETQALLKRLATCKTSLGQRMANQLYDEDIVSPELKEQMRIVKSRIRALEGINSQRESYLVLRKRHDTLKASLALAMAEGEDEFEDTGSSIVKDIRHTRPQFEAAEVNLFALFQQAGWPSEASHESMVEIVRTSFSGIESPRNVLVASTQNLRNEFHDPSLHRPSSGMISSSGQQVAQTPRAINQNYRDNLPSNRKPAKQAPDLLNFSRNMGSPTTTSLFADEFDDHLDDDEILLGATEAYEIDQDTSHYQLNVDRQPRKVLTEMSDNIRRQKSPTKAGSALPSKQHPWSKDVDNAMRTKFHLQGFRHNQLEAINATLSGKDAFVLMPTGGGKSLCYQLPSIIKSGKTRGITVVISPLLSLMQDQVEHLQNLSIQAVMVNGESTREHKSFVYQALQESEPESVLQLLYVTPEMVGKSQVMTNKFGDLHKRRKLARIVIDEAHCVSQWGHDFRPDYKALGEIRMQFPGVPVMALTATATENVKVDVIHNLRMDGCEVFTQSFNRPNLSYEVRPKPKGPQLLETIADTISSSHSKQSGIVYCLSRKACESLASRLKAQYGIKATHYHAGMDSEARIDVQKKWQAGQFHVIVATIAFGMGIDKPDVRFVIHQDLPKSLESYYQETGRAGRDGKESSCYLYYGYGDTTRIKRMIEKNKDASWEQKERQKQMLRNVVQFCENRSDCRRVQVLAYFNEHFSRGLCHKTCDNCQSASAFKTVDFSEHAKGIIRLVQQVQGANVTLLHCVDVYRGAANRKINDLDHKNLEQYGKGSDLDRGEVERLFYQLISHEAIEEKNVVNRAGYANAYIIVGTRHQDFLDGSTSLKIQVRTSPQPTSRVKTVGKPGKRQRGTGVVAANDCPASTNVSSPIDTRRTKKRQALSKPLATLYDESDEERDDDLVSFDPVRSASQKTLPKRRPLGPPITIDDRIARLDEAHRHMLQDFVDNASRELREIAVQRGLRQRAISDTVLREIGILFPNTIEEFRQINGLTEEKVRTYGPVLLRHVENARRDYQAIVDAQGIEVSVPRPTAAVEISDDDDDDDGDGEENFLSDDDFDIDGSQRSHYFNQTGDSQRSQHSPPRPTHKNTAIGRFNSDARQISKSDKSKAKRDHSLQDQSPKRRASQGSHSFKQRKYNGRKGPLRKKAPTGPRKDGGNAKRGTERGKRQGSTANVGRLVPQASTIGMMPT